jgi:hypothetical protein
MLLPISLASAAADIAHHLVHQSNGLHRRETRPDATMAAMADFSIFLANRWHLGQAKRLTRKSIINASSGASDRQYRNPYIGHQRMSKPLAGIKPMQPSLRTQKSGARAKGAV